MFVFGSLGKIQQKNRNHEKWVENEIPVLRVPCSDAGPKLIISVSIIYLMLCKESIQ